MGWLVPIYVLLAICFFIVLLASAFGAVMLERGKYYNEETICGNISDQHGNKFIVEYPKHHYFRFFERQGKLYYPTYKKSLGIACVLKTHPVDRKDVWFLADYKVNRDWRNRNVGAIFISCMLPWGWWRCSRMYSLVMGKQIGDMRYLRWWSFLLHQFEIYFYIVEARFIDDREGLPTRYIDAEYAVDTNWTKKFIVDGSEQTFYHLLPTHGNREKIKFEKLSDIKRRMDNNKVMIWLSEKEKKALEKQLPSEWARGIIISHNMPVDEDFHWLSTLDL